ncbi:MAG: helix-turn-helix domain-containing protein [Candidatus Methylomirabilales bacterium]
MSRPLRLEFPEAWYHVMNRGSGSRAIFHDDDDRWDFLRLLRDVGRMWSIQLHAFCLMRNHYHLLLHTPQGNLSRSMRHLNGLYTQRYNRKYRRDGPLFRGRFKAILIEADAYLLELVRYIHLNPVQAGLVRKPEQYAWSSHRAYLERGSSPDWLTKEEVLGRLGARGGQAVRNYRAFLQAGVLEQIKRVYGQKKAPAMLGTEAFKERARNLVSKKRRGDYELAEAKALPFRRTATEVLEAVKENYGVRRKALVGVRRGQWNEPRDVAIYLCRKECGLPLREIAALFGIPAYTTVSMACARVEARCKKDRVVRQRVERLLKVLGGE